VGSKLQVCMCSRHGMYSVCKGSGSKCTGGEGTWKVQPWKGVNGTNVRQTVWRQRRKKTGVCVLPGTCKNVRYRRWRNRKTGKAVACGRRQRVRVHGKVNGTRVAANRRRTKNAVGGRKAKRCACGNAQPVSSSQPPNRRRRKYAGTA